MYINYIFIIYLYIIKYKIQKAKRVVKKEEPVLNDKYLEKFFKKQK